MKIMQQLMGDDERSKEATRELVIALMRVCVHALLDKEKTNGHAKFCSLLLSKDFYPCDCGYDTTAEIIDSYFEL